MFENYSDFYSGSQAQQTTQSVSTPTEETNYDYIILTIVIIGTFTNGSLFILLFFQTVASKTGQMLFQFQSFVFLAWSMLSPAIGYAL